MSSKSDTLNIVLPILTGSKANTIGLVSELLDYHNLSITYLD
jgi:hypothetical protein